MCCGLRTDDANNATPTTPRRNLDKTTRARNERTLDETGKQETPNTVNANRIMSEFVKERIVALSAGGIKSSREKLLGFFNANGGAVRRKRFLFGLNVHFFYFFLSFFSAKGSLGSRKWKFCADEISFYIP